MSFQVILKLEDMNLKGIMGELKNDVGRTWRESWENLRMMLVEPGGNPGRT